MFNLRLTFGEQHKKDPEESNLNKSHAISTKKRLRRSRSLLKSHKAIAGKTLKGYNNEHICKSTYIKTPKESNMNKPNALSKERP